MRYMLSSVALIALLGALTNCGKPPSDDAEVFGVKMGDPISSLAANKPIARDPDTTTPMVNYIFKPSQPNANFTYYAALATRDRGVCALQAKGLQAPGEYDEIKGALTEKYGAPTEDAAASADYWYPELDSKKNPPSTIHMIMLIHLGADMTILYQFKNLGDCTKELLAAGL